MKSFVQRFSVGAALKDVSAFHGNTQSLKRLTPPPMIIQFHHLDNLADGSIADFTLWFGPIPIRWKAVHSNVDPVNGITDTQVQGPFESWVHKHTFIRIEENRTEIVDEVSVSYGKGVFRGIISRLMWINLPVLFAYRRWKTRSLLETES